ncbi:MAG: hypothetical protein IT518_01735 [Burkholderiales bacterium]|nr:hypothetical protein [Burkholderiales bacterium]
MLGAAGRRAGCQGSPGTTGEQLKVLVTGSNIPTVDREAAVPVQIITREDIQRANFQSGE